MGILSFFHVFRVRRAFWMFMNIRGRSSRPASAIFALMDVHEITDVHEHPLETSDVHEHPKSHKVVSSQGVDWSMVSGSRHPLEHSYLHR